MGYSTGVQRNEMMRERSECGVIFFSFSLPRQEGGRGGGTLENGDGAKWCKGGRYTYLYAVSPFPTLTFFPTSYALFFSLLFVTYTPRLYTDLYTVPL